jgi:hypothetical protein
MLAVARMLLDAGADPNSTVGGRPGQPDHCSTLFAAAGCADNPAITALLLDHGATPDDHTIHLPRYTPVISACGCCSPGPPGCRKAPRWPRRSA